MISGFRAKQTARTALRLLERERRALLSGRFAALSGLSTELERCVDVLETQPRREDPEFLTLLDQIRAAARHNRSLAEAARRGLRTAARLREQTRAGAARMQTYTPLGRAQVILDAGAKTNDRRT